MSRSQTNANISRSPEEDRIWKQGGQGPLTGKLDKSKYIFNTFPMRDQQHQQIGSPVAVKI